MPVLPQEILGIPTAYYESLRARPNILDRLPSVHPDAPYKWTGREFTPGSNESSPFSFSNNKKDDTENEEKPSDALLIAENAQVCLCTFWN